MEIKISKDVATYLGETKLRIIGLEYNARGYSDYYNLNLTNLIRQQIIDLRGWLDDAAKLGVRGPKVLIKDIDTWLNALVDAGNQRARTVNHFSSLITEYLRRVPGHRIYKRVDNEGIAYTAYYVNEVVYHPETQNSRDRIPAYTELELLYFELGGRTASRHAFDAESVRGMTASEALAKAGYFVETPELRTAYLKETVRFNEIAPRIGCQFYATGSGTDNLDGNTQSSNWSSYNDRKYTLSNSKVVIDVFYEVEKERKSREGYLNQHFWVRKIPKAIVATEGFEDLDADDATSSGDSQIVSIEIPTHPFCAVFDLRRHLRLRVHVNYLTEYVYDAKMDEKLILPQITKDLVSTLISQSRVGFADIIEGKGMGVCVLLGGAPGLGKTLTAEVFAEASERPLYSIQAAQLGIAANTVEANLNRFLARGSRWKAIILIDEADVYIRTRDKDMEHNAIVAAILRILEYQTAILFMTTNLPDQVDDAIVSRCIARINYHTPSTEEQKQIWRILARMNNVPLDDGDIDTNVFRHPNLAGRDIKQLLKLAVLHTAKNKESITPAIVDFVAQFQPTIREHRDEDNN